MNRFHFSAALVALSLFALGCPSTDDDDDSGSELPGLCSGPGCQNAAECPAEEPPEGGACDFVGNCHYCFAETSASGYTCDGNSFTFVELFDCTAR